MNTSERMHDIIRGAIPEGDFIPSVVAQKIATSLSEQEPGFLDVWLHEHAAYFITHMLTIWVRNNRRASIERAQHGIFRDAAERAQAGEGGVFAQLYVVSEERLRRRVGEMTGADHNFVAARYEGSAQRSALLAEFHRVVARKVKKRNTSSVMSEEQYEALLQNVLGSHEQEGAA
jgi:hypothetical protein